MVRLALLRVWAVPAIATLTFFMLLWHKSEFPVVFGRYSVDYTVLLAAAALNVVLLWYTALRGLSYAGVARGLYPVPLSSLLALVIAIGILVDFFALELPSRRSHWATVGLLSAIVVQLRALSVITMRRLALIVSSLAVGVILLEGVFAFALVEHWTPKSSREFDRLMASRWPRPVQKEKPAGTFRILGLADSFGIWGGFASNYHYLLERELRRDFSPAMEIVNVSIPASEPRHQAAILRHGLAYSPDLVLHGFFVGNDFTTVDWELYGYRNIVVQRNADALPYRPRDYLVRGWLEGVRGVFQEERRRHAELLRGDVDAPGTFSRRSFLRAEFDKVRAFGTPTQGNMERMREVLPVLDELRSLAEKGGARYAMVIHPDEAQVNERLRDELVRGLHVDLAQYDFDLPQRILAAYCAEREILCLDLLPEFRAASGQGDLYLLRDSHYNERGNRLAAATIRRFLQDRGLLPGILKRAVFEAAERTQVTRLSPP